MPEQWLSIEAWKAKGAPADVGVRKAFTAQIGALPDDAFRFAITTGQVDRDGDTIDPKGWHLEDYLKNPVVLWAHDYAALPVGQAVGIHTAEDRLVSDVKFHDDVHELARAVKALVARGALRAASVGFKPSDYEVNQKRGGVDFRKQALLEWSIVPVPSNPQALAELKSAGIDLAPLRRWAEEWLEAEAGAGFWISKATLEGVWKAAAPTTTVTMPSEVRWFLEPTPSVTVTPKAPAGGGMEECSSPNCTMETPDGETCDEDACPLKAAQKAAATVSKRIVQRGDQWCVVSMDGAHTFGCHATRAEAVNHLQAIEAHKHRDAVSVAVIRELCPSCADTMDALGWTHLKWDALQAKPDLLDALKKAGFSQGLCDKFGGGEGFRTRCMEHMGSKVEDAAAFCNKLKEFCFGDVTAGDKAFGFDALRLEPTSALEAAGLTADAVREVYADVLAKVTKAELQAAITRTTGRVF